MSKKPNKSDKPIVNTIADLIKTTAQRKGIDTHEAFHDFTTLGFVYFNTLAYYAIQLKTDTTDKVIKMKDELLAKYADKMDLLNALQLGFSLLHEKMQEAPSDYLGELFHILELHNKYRGQFFTPIHIAEFMGACSYSGKEEIETIIKEKGYFSISDPCCGAGVMLIGFYKNLMKM